jgi:hypothetical protein
MKWFQRLMLILVAATQWALPASAQFVTLSIEDMTRKAEVIVHAKVANKTCHLDAGGRVYTRVELQILDLWKGEVDTRPLVVVHGGGTVGQRTGVVTGQVDYQVGEEVVAFLVLNMQGQGVTLGLAQGKFHVWQSPASSAKFARNMFHGKIEEPNNADPAKVDFAIGSLTLAALEQQIKAANQ